MTYEDITIFLSFSLVKETYEKKIKTVKNSFK